MNEQQERFINRKGLDPAFDADEMRKTNLFFESKLLLAQRRFDEAAPKLAEAAEIEERLAAVCESKGLLEKAWVHQFSAVCAWAKAGNLYAAIELGANLLCRPELPAHLHQEVGSYVQVLRSRREQFSEERELVSAGAGT